MPWSTRACSAMISSTQLPSANTGRSAGSLGVDLVDGEVVVGQQGLQMVRDAPERVLERIGRQDPGGGVDEGVQRSAAPLRRLVLRRSQSVYRPAGTRELDREGAGVPFVACGTNTARRARWCASGGCPHRSARGPRGTPRRGADPSRARLRMDRPSAAPPRSRPSAGECDVMCLASLLGHPNSNPDTFGRNSMTESRDCGTSSRRRRGRSNASCQPAAAPRRARCCWPSRPSSGRSTAAARASGSTSYARELFDAADARDAHARRTGSRRC